MQVHIRCREAHGGEQHPALSPLQPVASPEPKLSVQGVEDSVQSRWLTPFQSSLCLTMSC